MLSKTDHDRIHAAIAAAEQRTSGEIFCVVAQEAGHYREVAFAWAAAVALLAPPLSMLLGLRPSFYMAAVMTLLDNGWVASHVGGLNAAVAAALVGYAAVQAGLFILVLTIMLLAPVRRLLTPAPLKHAQVHTRAMEQFAHRLHTTRAATGVLVFASLAEHRVEIVADEAIHAMVGRETWDRAIQAALKSIRAGDTAAGLIAAVEICGQVLAQHCPSDGPREDFGDDVVEI
ncbi:MAG TPA: TPM domain-containing protein [Caulobacteraceae bacterium]|jgi:putative membrane protein|nr:TPM domain-containing protein [Caulobacteraceae bacterium]